LPWWWTMVSVWRGTWSSRRYTHTLPPDPQGYNKNDGMYVTTTVTMNVCMHNTKRHIKDSIKQIFHWTTWLHKIDELFGFICYVWLNVTSTIAYWLWNIYIEERQPTSSLYWLTHLPYLWLSKWKPIQFMLLAVLVETNIDFLFPESELIMVSGHWHTRGQPYGTGYHQHFIVLRLYQPLRNCIACYNFYFCFVCM